MGTSFKVTVRKRRKDGLWPVYIRVTHNRKIEWIKTDKLVTDEGLTGRGEVKDVFVLEACQRMIVGYVDRLNRTDAGRWSVKEVVELLRMGDGDVSFSEYARRHIGRMMERGQERSARNYRWALQCLERYMGTTDVMFGMLTGKVLTDWIGSLERSHRAKEMYPVCMRQVWRAAELELNDVERGVVPLKVNPWLRVRIPQSDRTEKLAISVDACRRFFDAPLPKTDRVLGLPEVGRDVAKMVLCLGGINTVDLYNLRKADYYDGVIHYRRAKTRKSRSDEAYMEMRVPDVLRPLMEKYGAGEDSEWLFWFRERYSSSDSFSGNVNSGIRKICESMGMAREDWYCVYTFRHTWGTVAQNDCGASIAEVAFGMNHASGHRVTRGYLKLSFEPAWRLNEMVVERVFGERGEDLSQIGISGLREQHSSRDDSLPGVQAEGLRRFSPKSLIRGSVFFRGRLLGELEDIGYGNVDEVIGSLMPFVPRDVPAGCMLLFRVENVDRGDMAVYKRAWRGASYFEL